MKQVGLFVCVLIATLWSAVAVHAQEVVKANNTDALNLGSSWVGGTVPTSSNVAVWNSTLTGSNTVALGGDLSLSGIKIMNPGSIVTVSAGNRLTLGASGIDMSSASANLTISSSVALAAIQEWRLVGSRILTIGGSLDNGGYTLTINNSAPVQTGFSNTYLNGIVSGSGGLTKNGSGSLVFANVAHSYTGDFTLNGGFVNAGNNATALGSGSSRLTLVSGTLTAKASGARNFGRNTTVSGNVTFENNNSSSNAAQPYTFGTLSIGEQTFTVTAMGTNSGTLTFGATTLTGNATFNVGSRDINFLVLGAAGESGGSRGLTKSGVGTLQITGVSTYTGTTTISGGALALAGAGALSSSSAIVNNATLNISGIAAASTTIGQLSGSGSVLVGGKALTLGGSSDSSFSGTITGSTGSITKQGSGFQTLSGANAYDGTTTVNQGGLVIASTGALPGWSSAGRFSVANGATLAVGNAVTDANVTTLMGTGNFAAGSRLGFDTSNGSREYTEVLADTSNGALGLTKLGSGTLALSGINTFSGGLTVADGALLIGAINNAGSNGPLGSGVSAAVFGSSGKRGALTYSGATASSSRAFTAFAGGTAAFTVTDAAATLTLSGLIGGDGEKTFGGPGNVVLSGGISGGSSNVFKTGTGALTLAGASGHANTTVSEGRLNINYFSALGTSSGTLSMAGGTTLDNTSGASVGVTNGKSISLGSSLNFIGSNSLDLGPGTATLSGATTIDVAANALTFSGDVVGAGYGLTKIGAGVLELGGLSGSSSFTGNSFINAGELYLTGHSVLGGGSSTIVTVADGAFLRVGSSASLGGVTVVSRPGGLITASVVNANQTFDQTGTLSIDNANFNGIQTILTGVAINAAANYLGTIPASPVAGRIVIDNGATLRATEEFHIDPNQGIALASGTGIFSVDSAKALFVQSVVSGSGGILKTGVGNVRLTGSNSYTGGTVIEQGIVGITTDASLGDVSGRLKLDGGTIVAAQTVSGGTVSGATINASRQVVLANGKTSGMHAQTGLTLRYDGVIGEESVGGTAANLVFGFTAAREGKVILGGANTYRGTTTVSAGTLVVNGSLGEGAVTVAPSAMLMGSGTINGLTSIQGSHSPGNSPGLETFTNGLTYGSSSTLIWELSANTAEASARGSLYDGIDLTGGSLSIAPGATINLVFNAALAGGGSSTTDWDDAFWGSAQTWKVIDVQSGLWTPGLFTLGSIGNDASGQSLISSIRSGASFNMSQGTDGDIYVNYLVIVPEPDTVIFAGIGIAMAGWSLWRRKHLAKVTRR